MNPNPPIKGHTLISDSRWTRHGWIGGCVCGAKPPDFHRGLSAAAVRQWHREHKAELRAAAEEA